MWGAWDAEAANVILFHRASDKACVDFLSCHVAATYVTADAPKRVVRRQTPLLDEDVSFRVGGALATEVKVTGLRTRVVAFAHLESCATAITAERISVLQG